MAEYIKREYAMDAVLGVYYDTPDIYLSDEKFEAAILKIQAADVAPVRHAKWGINVGMNFFKERNCPVCKKRIESNFWNFCPNCGCRMDLEG